MYDQFAGFFWFIVLLVPLTFFQRLLHREIQAVTLIVTRNPGITMGIFALIFLPGVFLHELSHFLMAKLLRVPTGNFSLMPQPLPDGRLQLGYVETGQSDIVRDSLIGAAPLIVGTIFVAYTAVYQLEMRILWDTFRNGQFNLFWMGVTALPRVPDFFLWFYLAFTVSSTMMPSQSDRHAWLDLLVAVGVIFGVALVAGAGPWIMSRIAPLLSNFLSSVAVIFVLSVVVHGILILPVALIHKIVARITGLDVR